MTLAVLLNESAIDRYRVVAVHIRPLKHLKTLCGYSYSFILLLRSSPKMAFAPAILDIFVDNFRSNQAEMVWTHKIMSEDS